MARDEKLPLARLYNKVSPTLHTPVWTCVVVGALSAVPFLYFAGAGLVAIAATGMIYFSYLLGNIAILIARRRGWPTEGAPFKLGGWGMVVNVLALVWGGSMLLNFLWPRPATNPPMKIRNTQIKDDGGMGFLATVQSLGNSNAFASSLGWSVNSVNVSVTVSLDRGRPPEPCCARSIERGTVQRGTSDPVRCLRFPRLSCTA